MNFTKTKKVVAAGLSALMMMSSTTSVFAAETGDKSANLNYQVSSSEYNGWASPSNTVK